MLSYRKEKQAETKMIGVAGAGTHAGCTHMTIMLATGLHALGYKTAVLEDCNHGHFTDIAGEYGLKTNNNGEFNYYGVDYYPFARPRALIRLLQKSYHYIVVDHGDFGDCDRDFFLTSASAVICCGSRPWEINRLEAIFDELEDETVLSALYYSFLFAFSNKALQSQIKRGMDSLKNIVFPAYTENPFRDYDAKTLEQIAHVPLPAKGKLLSMDAGACPAKKKPFVLRKEQEEPPQPPVGAMQPSIPDSGGISAAPFKDSREELAAEPELEEAREPGPEPEAKADTAREPEPGPEAKPEPEAEADTVPESEPEPEAKPEPEAEADTAREPEPGPEAKPEPEAEADTAPEPEMNIEKDIPEPERDINRKEAENLVFGRFKREDSTFPHAETESQKYMDTMWFQTFHISCDTEDGYMPEDFDLIVYPLALEKDRMPVPIAACLAHHGVYKAGFSENGKYSIALNYEDYVFSLTLRFVDGEMKTKISLSSLSEERYKITNIEHTDYQSKDIVPESFGKQIRLKKDMLEIYPLEAVNESMTGCAAFMYRMISEDGRMECGLSEERSLTIAADNKAIRYFCYWEGHDKERKLIVAMD